MQEQTINGITLDPFTIAYLETALWAEHDNADENGGEPLDANYDIGDFTAEALQRAKDVCNDFRQMEWSEDRDPTERTERRTMTVQAWLDSIDRPAVKQYSDGEWSAAESDGHDFWLTRGGHGAGFWDRGYGDIGRIVTAACKTFGEAYIGVCGDGTLDYHE